MKADFDNAAADYDLHFTHSIIGKAQRQRIWKYLESRVLTTFLRHPLNILELNCGTGEDALWFAQKGHQVVATDVSENILSVAQKKITANNLSSKIQVQKLDLTQITNQVFDRQFELVFSNFGGFNCLTVESLKKLNVYLSRQLTDKGEAVLVIMPQDTLVEKMFALKHRDFNRIKERKSKEGTLVNVNGTDVRTYFYNWEKIATIFNAFEVVNVFASGLVPSYLEGFIQRNKNIWEVVQRMEKQMESKQKLANLGDHFVLHLRLK